MSLLTIFFSFLPLDVTLAVNIAIKQRKRKRNNLEGNVPQQNAYSLVEMHKILHKVGIKSLHKWIQNKTMQLPNDRSPIIVAHICFNYYKKGSLLLNLHIKKKGFNLF